MYIHKYVNTKLKLLTLIQPRILFFFLCYIKGNDPLLN
jgi:hypothetical protein